MHSVRVLRCPSQHAGSIQFELIAEVFHTRNILSAVKRPLSSSKDQTTHEALFLLCFQRSAFNDCKFEKLSDPPCFPCIDVPLIAHFHPIVCSLGRTPDAELRCHSIDSSMDRA